jgi:(1->4)-alpha-D-glucan 1-alpha-D-glucosylmutase
MNSASLVPLAATYRLQLHAHLNFDQVRRLIPYLSQLGVSTLYLAPIFRANPGSTHGYDVVDHEQLEPSLGSEDDFAALATAARAQGLSILVDLIPNHMGIHEQHNRWWREVLQHGACTPYANFFDIDWFPPKLSQEGKVLLPILGDQFGNVLESQGLELILHEREFAIRYYDRIFPTDPRSWKSILESVRDVLDPTTAESAELAASIELILERVRALPTTLLGDEFSIRQRTRLCEDIKQRWAELCDKRSIQFAVDETLKNLNGTAGFPSSFDRLEALLEAQPYRLCYWRVATDEINYRRFFDVDSLAAIRVEEPAVFDAVHHKVLSYIERGWISGIRCDHLDGLADPQAYLDKLAQCANEALATARDAGLAVPARPYLLVEKILGAGEALPREWPIDGTTGYEFLNTLTALHLDPQGIRPLRRLYDEFLDDSPRYPQILYESKRTILGASLSSELIVLAHQLSRLAERQRNSRDFTRPALQRALREIVACFPVYRTYFRPGHREAREQDRRHLQMAVREAKRRQASTDPSYFDFIESLLLEQDTATIPEELRVLRSQFIIKFQQVTGPVTAKGLEDTAFYRYYPLASLNEVGGHPNHGALTLADFHREMEERAAHWPRAMLTTATHDTKRGEDMRARVNVLSEVPQQWGDAIRQWRELNAPVRQPIEGEETPTPNEEYLIYQTLAGTWPLEPQSRHEWQTYRQRIVTYFEKALREAKTHTSWLHPNQRHEAAVYHFIETILGEGNTSFVKSLHEFVHTLANAGFLNSLSQTTLKMCAPGVPDFYQGSELWDFRLVDPDNRRPVDFELRAKLLGQLQAAANEDLPQLARELLQTWPDDRIKLHTIARTLNFRRDHANLFDGDYLPLTCHGPRELQQTAFARTDHREWLVCVAPRRCWPAWQEAHDNAPPGSWPLAEWWRGTELMMPAAAPRRWRHILSGAELETQTGDSGPTLALRSLLSSFPVAILHGTS